GAPCAGTDRGGRRRPRRHRHRPGPPGGGGRGRRAAPVGRAGGRRGARDSGGRRGRPRGPACVHRRKRETVAGAGAPARVPRALRRGLRVHSTTGGTGAMMKSMVQVGCIALLLAPTLAFAQRGDAERRVYCWEEGGRKVCGDALPASAVDAARTEISAATGTVRARVGRAMTDEEREAAEAEARRAAAAAEAEAAERRRDLAMVESYTTEADLERAYDNRIILIDESIKTSQMGVANLRMS